MSEGQGTQSQKCIPQIWHRNFFYSFFGGGRNEWNHAYLGKENGVFQAYLHLQVQFQFEVGTNGAEK